MEQKTHSQKATQDEKAEGYVPDEGTRSNPRKTTKRSRDRQPSRKRIQNNDTEDDPGPRKKNGGKDREDARNVFKKNLERIKEKTTDEQYNN